MKTRSFPLIYPTTIFAGLIFVVAVMWYASASQNNAASYLLLFFTVAIFLVSIPHALLNLSGLKVRIEAVQPAFAGQEVAVPVEVVNESRRARHGCAVTLPGLDKAGERIDEIDGGKAARVTLRFPVEARGEYQISQVQLRSSYHSASSPPANARSPGSGMWFTRRRQGMRGSQPPVRTRSART